MASAIAYNRVVIENAHDLRAVHRLAGAILLQALEDIRVGSGRRRAEALEWLMENRADEQFSFRFCCRILQRSPEQVRRWATRLDFPAASWQAHAVMGQESMEWAVASDSRGA